VPPQEVQRPSVQHPSVQRPSGRPRLAQQPLAALQRERRRPQALVQELVREPVLAPVRVQAQRLPVGNPGNAAA